VISKNISDLPSISEKKSAAISFYRIINGINLPAHFQYIALSDQDDIWFSNKLVKAINLLSKNKFSGYSSSVLAFWKNGSNQYIKKSGFSSPENALFESAGPGCTYVLKREVFELFRLFLKKNMSTFEKIDFHDWAIYAFVTNAGFEWYIDSSPSMYYRQHKNNSFGASSSLKQKIKRFNMIKEGWYFYQVYLLHKLYKPNFILISGSKFKLFKRAYLFFSLLKLRRRLFDKISLAILSLFCELPVKGK